MIFQAPEEKENEATVRPRNADLMDTPEQTREEKLAKDKKKPLIDDLTKLRTGNETPEELDDDECHNGDENSLANFIEVIVKIKK